jgi:hypothetical protein
MMAKLLREFSLDFRGCTSTRALCITRRVAFDLQASNPMTTPLCCYTVRAAIVGAFVFAGCPLPDDTNDN